MLSQVKWETILETQRENRACMPWACARGNARSCCMQTRGPNAKHLIFWWLGACQVTSPTVLGCTLVNSVATQRAS